MSIDGITYSQVDTLGSPLRQGFLTSSLPAAAGWDSVDTLAVNLAESGGTLSGTSQAAAQQGGTLSLVDGEFLGYEVATLTTVSNYNLTGLARGVGGSTPTAHNTGAPFARLDGAVGRFDLPANLAGKMLFFKFQSFNTLGGGLQDLSTCTVYTYATMSLSVLQSDLRAASDWISSRSRPGDGRTYACRRLRIGLGRGDRVARSRRHCGSGRSSDRSTVAARIAGRPWTHDGRRNAIRRLRLNE